MFARDKNLLGRIFPMNNPSKHEATLHFHYINVHLVGTCNIRVVDTQNRQAENTCKITSPPRVQASRTA